MSSVITVTRPADKNCFNVRDDANIFKGNKMALLNVVQFFGHHKKVQADGVKVT